MSDAETGPAQASWRQRPERSNMLMLRVMTWISLRLGRAAGRCVLYGISAYFLLANAAARRASRDYLQRALDVHQVGWRHIFRHFLCFASCVHDRVYLINDRFNLFDIRVHQEHLIAELTADRKGVFLMGAHMGSFEVLRTIGRRRPGMRVAMVMFEDNARKINAALSAINPAAQQDIVALGHADSMLKVHELIESGGVVGMLADRCLNHDSTRPVPFLGESAGFPVGPFRMAAILRRPVLFMVGLYGGGNRYDIHFETLADFSTVPAGAREAAVQAAIARYAQLLEAHCRAAPYNWFNFFDFWQPALPSPESHPVSPMQDKLRPSSSRFSALFAGVGLLLALMATPAVAAWDITQLMQGLAQNKSGRASFVEKKYIALLDKPVESSGELLYTAPDRLEKRTFKPRPESMLIESGTLTVERNKRRMTLRLQDYPELVAFTESIRGTLAGDVAALRRIYNLELEGSEERWTLILRPVETRMLEVVQRIRIGGSRAEVKTIEIEQTDKDRSVMVIAPLAP